MTGTAAFDAVGRALVQRCAGDLPAVLAPVLDPLGTVGPLDHAAQFRWQHLQGQRPASRTPQRHVVRLHAKVPVVPRPALGVRVLEVPPLLSRRPILRKRAPLRPPRLHHPPQDEPRRALLDAPAGHRSASSGAMRAFPAHSISAEPPAPASRPPSSAAARGGSSDGCCAEPGLSRPPRAVTACARSACSAPPPAPTAPPPA